MANSLPSSLSSFWFYELAGSGILGTSVLNVSTDFSTALSVGSSLFRKRGFVLLRLLQIFRNSVFNSKLGRSLLSTIASILSLGLFMPKYGQVGGSAVVYNTASSTLGSAGSSHFSVLGLEANTSLTDTPFLYFPTVGFYSKLKKFLFFYFTRLVSVPLLGQLDIFLWRGKLFDTENNLELYFFLGLRLETIMDRKSVFYKIY
jgi:hypothetical protein